MPNTKAEIQNIPLLDRATLALTVAHARLLKERAAKDETVVISRNGKVEHVLASDILAEHPEIEEVLKYGNNDGK